MADELLNCFRATYGDALMEYGFKQYQNTYIKVLFDQRILLCVSLIKERYPHPDLGIFDINLFVISLFYEAPILIEWGHKIENIWKDLIKGGGLSLDRYLRWIKKIEKRKNVFYTENFTNSFWMYKRNDRDEMDRQMKDSYSYFSQYLLEYCKIQDFKTYYGLDEELKWPEPCLLYEHLYMKNYDKAIEFLNQDIQRQKDTLRKNKADFTANINMYKKLKSFEELLNSENDYEFRIMRDIDVNYQIKEMLEKGTYDKLNKKLEEVYESNKEALCKILNI